jgi:serine/threonine protein kinase
LRRRRSVLVYHTEEVFDWGWISCHYETVVLRIEVSSWQQNITQVNISLSSNSLFIRDIKPENFMLAYKNDITCIKLIDFGLSKDYSGEEIMATPSGSPYYIAPEVFL